MPRLWIASAIIGLALTGCAQPLPKYIESVMSACGKDGVLISGQSRVTPKGHIVHIMSCVSRK